MGSTEQPGRRWALPVLAGGFAAALLWLPILAALVAGGVLALAGVVAFGRPSWRLAALLAAALLLGFSAIETVAREITLSPVNLSVVKTYQPPSWVIDDPELGYRPHPGQAVRVEAHYGHELVFRQTYTIEPDGARATTGSRDGRSTYLFVGDSFIFGEGLADGETLASQFSRRLTQPASVVNLGVPGYGPNHWVRAFETGLYDRYVVGKVAAVVTWIIPAQMARVTGDEDWLGSSPRYVLTEGWPRHTGSFADHRQRDVWARASYWGRHHLASVARAAEPMLEQERSRLYVALVARLRDLVSTRYGAPLIVLYDWPDRDLPDQGDLQHLSVFRALQALNIPLLSTRHMMGVPDERWADFFFAHDGHPNNRLTAGIAAALPAVLESAGVGRD